MTTTRSLHTRARMKRPLAVLAAATLALVPATGAPSPRPELRGVWMHANFIRTRAEADACVETLVRAHFNAAFLLVWYWGGQAAFRTDLCPMLEGVEPGYDPLQYMVRQCRPRGIEVHAWFVNGAYGHPTPLHVLDRHPDWTVDGGGHPGTLWYDLGKPDVRKFQADLMIDALTRCNPDGLHFDYIRYDGPALCHCDPCQAEFAARYGCGRFDPPRRASFPFADLIAGNPVAGPTTATVLAQFSDGTPAIATNELGQGKVLLFNWHALHKTAPAVADTLRRALAQWDAPRAKLHVIDTAPNRARYGARRTAEGAAALRALGHQVTGANEEQLDSLPPRSVVVLADVYLIPDQVALALERFVRAGGLLVVVDGPVLAIRSAPIQRVLGMNRTARYMNRIEAIQPAVTSDLLTCAPADIDLAQLQRRLVKWAEYRKEGVTALVRDVYRRVKTIKPDTMVTAAVFASLESADRVFQDWPGWLRAGLVDYVVPMAYSPDNKVIARQLDEWTAIDPRLERILPGLCIYTRQKDKDKDALNTRDPATILTQYRMCVDKGARGVNLFALDGTAAEPVLLLDAPLIRAPRSGPFQTATRAYRPPPPRTVQPGAPKSHDHNPQP